MRRLTWGQFPAQQTDFAAAELVGRSIIVDGGASNNNSTTVYDGATIPLYHWDSTTGVAHKPLIKVALSKIRAQLGHSPVLIAARLWIYTLGTANTYTGYNLALFRLLTVPDWADVDYRYRDVSAVAGWGGDAAIYSPVPGQDHQAAPFSTVAIPASPSLAAQWLAFDVTSELRYKLAANEDLVCMLSQYPIKQPGASAVALAGEWKASAHYPYLELIYLMPIEFFGAHNDASIDLTKILINALDITTGNLYLGAVERGQTGSAVPFFVKNLGTRTLAHLEEWLASPEWSDPVADPGNAGSGVLSRVTLSTTAVSQKWTFKFTSASAFTVKAEAYQDNPTNLNPSFGGTGWTGTTGTDWTSPSGGLTVPSAAWSGTPVANDLFVVYTTGGVQDPSWAADSGSQVQIAEDAAGAPDANTWRPLPGQRTVLTSPVTIDATTKTLAVRYINTALWPDNTKIFVADGTNIDRGYISSKTSTSITIVFPSATGHVYAAGAKVCTTLPVRNLGTGLWAVSTGAAGPLQTNPAQIPLTDAATLGFSIGQTIAIRSVDDTSIIEDGTIQAVDDVKITLSAYLTHDFPSGSMVMAAGSGEARSWAKPVAALTTLEELKRLRISVRT